MARTISRILDLLQQYEPKFRQAFLEAIVDIRGNAELGRIAEALDRHDVEAAIRAVHLDPAAFRGLDNLIVEAFNAGGAATVGAMPAFRAPDGGKVVVSFDGRNLRAEQWLREHSATLVTRIVDDQRAAIRQALTEGMTTGRNPRQTALDVIGRVNRATGKREGGIIGLTSQQSAFVESARQELVSGDSAALRNYLQRGRRDKRFDRTVQNAIAEKKALDRTAVNRISGRYADGLLMLRGETIARTESLAALHEAQDEAFRQAVDAGAVNSTEVRKVWRSAHDWRVRHTHRELNGESVGLDEAFESASGAMLRYPCDPRAPASETANCRCHLDMRVDFLANIQ